jgi:hypothetical protein
MGFEYRMGKGIGGIDEDDWDMGFEYRMGKGDWEKGLERK